MKFTLNCRFLALLAALGALLSSPAFASTPIDVLDNTTGGSALLSGSGSTITADGNGLKALVFTTPNTGPKHLTAFRFGFVRETNGTDFPFTVDLKAVNGSNNPTGSALATMSADVTVSFTPTYFTFDLTTLPGSTYNGFALQNDTSYAIVVSGTGSGGNNYTFWTEPNGNPAPATADGFTYVKTTLSSNAGTSWSSSAINNSITITAVPEPANALLAGLLTAFVLGVILHRRTLR